jgi:hypothetical protein
VSDQFETCSAWHLRMHQARSIVQRELYRSGDLVAAIGSSGARICAQIRAWNRDPGAQPAITLHRADSSPPPARPGRIVKGWTYLTMAFRMPSIATTGVLAAPAACRGR